MSHRPPCGRATPRWSVGAQAPSALPGGAGLPALIAGLPARSAWFGVGPPLAAGGARRGSCPATFPVASPPSVQPARFPTRLYPPEVSVPVHSAPLGAVLAARIVLASVTGPAVSAIPPASPADVLKTTVALLRDTVPLVAMPPPAAALLFVLMEVFTSRRRPALAMPPPGAT